MSVIKSAAEHLAEASRVIVVLGANGSGKTTFSVSASSAAGETITNEASRRECGDVVLIGGDNEGAMGAMDAGLWPGGVVDLSDTESWEAYKKALVPALLELKQLIADGRTKFIILDLGLPANLIVNHVAPESISDWGEVGRQGALLRKAFQGLKGATVIVNAHIKSAHVAESKRPEVAAAQLAAADAKAIGGERSTFTIDAPGSIAKPWIANASFVFAREVKRRSNPMQKGEPPRRVFYTHTSANPRFDVKSRAHSVLKPTEPGERTLHSMLEAVYKAHR